MKTFAIIACVVLGCFSLGAVAQTRHGSEHKTIHAAVYNSVDIVFKSKARIEGNRFDVSFGTVFTSPEIKIDRHA